MKRILITGASGYVGAKLFRDLGKNYKVIGTFRNSVLFPGLQKLDVTDREAVLNTVAETRPDIVIHTSAVSSRSRCELEPRIAARTNSGGTQNLVDAVNQNNVQFLHISSLGAINPVTVYGRTKLDAEESVKKTKAGYTIIRLSVTFGCSPNTTNDRPFNRILQTLREGMPISYDNSWRFQPTYLQQVSIVIKELLEKKMKNKTVTLVVPERKTLFEVAADILRPFGKSVTPEKAKRPYNVIEEEEQASSEEFPIYTYEEMIRGITGEILDNQQTAG